MSDDADWRDVTPTTLDFEYEVQMHQDGRVRHRHVTRYVFECYDTTHTAAVLGTWIPGWPGKGMQW